MCKNYKKMSDAVPSAEEVVQSAEVVQSVEEVARQIVGLVGEGMTARELIRWFIKHCRTAFPIEEAHNWIILDKKEYKRFADIFGEYKYLKWRSSCCPLFYDILVVLGEADDVHRALMDWYGANPMPAVVEEAYKIIMSKGIIAWLKKE
jgi:hypothetical protein